MAATKNIVPRITGTGVTFTGAAIDEVCRVEGCNILTALIVGAAGATAYFQLSNDATNWATVGSGVTAGSSSVVAVDACAIYARVTSAGTITHISINGTR